MIIRLLLTNARLLLNEPGAVRRARSTATNWISGSDHAADPSFAHSTNQNLWSMHPVIAAHVSMATATRARQAHLLPSALIS